ncbi:hypothetical protein BU15DRAFT_88606 [Melanogaster broomeanus]|nr:hypothetical protein BU15DRAFT_88606 [Melanogaster broomeanus]
MSTQLTLYGNKAMRRYVYSTSYGLLSRIFTAISQIELALKEGNISYKFFNVNLFDKPAFFAAEVNPVGKVPAITYGGPDASPEEPSPLSTKLAESNVILEPRRTSFKAIEFVQDLLPESAKFAVGDCYTIADACASPLSFIGSSISAEADIGKFPVGTGPKFKELLNTPKYAKFMVYVQAMVDRPVAKEVFDVVVNTMNIASQSELQTDVAS